MPGICLQINSLCLERHAVKQIFPYAHVLRTVKKNSFRVKKDRGFSVLFESNKSIIVTSVTAAMQSLLGQQNPKRTLRKGEGGRGGGVVGNSLPTSQVPQQGGQSLSRFHYYEATRSISTPPRMGC